MHAISPEPSPMAGGRASVHGTAIAVAGSGLLLLGPAGSGKSSIAAQLMAFGAELISDDLVVLSREAGGIRLARPEGAASRIELRHIGLPCVPAAPQTNCGAVVLLGQPHDRLPARETWSVLGHDLPLIRHAATPDLPAKLLIWIRSTSVDADRRTSP